VQVLGKPAVDFGAYLSELVLPDARVVVVHDLGTEKSLKIGVHAHEGAIEQVPDSRRVGSDSDLSRAAASLEHHELTLWGNGITSEELEIRIWEDSGSIEDDKIPYDGKDDGGALGSERLQNLCTNF